MQSPKAGPAQLKVWEQQAISALRASRVDLAREPLDRIAQSFPEYPTLVALRRWAALTGFSWPAKRERVSPCKRASPPTGVDLVMFHIDLPANPSGHNNINYLQLARRSFEAAERKAPEARRILLTDNATEIPDNLNAHEIIRTPANLEFPMFERMRMQERYLAKRSGHRATVFMDVDIVANVDPLKLFAPNFDIAMTWRGHIPEAPINGGLILAGPGTEPQKFFSEALRCYEKLACAPELKPLWPQDLRNWWGDQYVWIAMIGYRKFAECVSSAVRINGAIVQFFSSLEYNFTPKPNIGYSPEFLASRYFLHFKGDRKPMADWYLDLIRDEKN